MVSIMKNVLIFGGTIEGRRLVERLQAFEVMLHVCVVSEYGANLLPKRDNICKHIGRLDEGAMQQLIADLAPVCCVDATHPYAQIVTENIATVCEKMSCPYIRLARELEQNVPTAGREHTEEVDMDSSIYIFDSVPEATQFLATTDGVIFATTGSKELDAYTEIPNYAERVIARVLPTVEVLQKCKQLGFEGRNLICMQGPFSEAMNYEMLRSSDAKWLVTKCTGSLGGYQEKYDAAIRAGVNLVLIGRPDEPETAVGFEQAFKMVCEHIGVDASCQGTPGDVTLMGVDAPCSKRVSIIGAGPGSRVLMTAEALYAIEDAEVLIGAKRILEICDPLNTKEQFVSYKADEILEYIANDKLHSTFGVVYSGDIGFYSGAKQLEECINRLQPDIEIKHVTGISSPIYLLNRVGIRWQDAVLVSNHGCEINIVSKVRANRVVATLIGSNEDVSTMCKRLSQNGLAEVTTIVGERLSYQDETIVSGQARDFVNRTFDKLSVAVFVNEHPVYTDELSDESFVRGAVPMTKQEIRTLSVAKLGINRDSVVYDVGAGTGSVTVAMALAAEDGVVYAIEQKEEAQQLIVQNAAKFGCTNIKLLAGSAPEVLEDLPAPTHVFIGGSSGNLIEIIETIRNKNKAARFVVNAVTLETIAKLSELGNQYSEYADMELLYVQISRGKQMGSHHLMTADNGIYIAVFGGNYETVNKQQKI